MATITDAGLEYFAKFFNYNESTDIITTIRIGSSQQTEGTTDTDLITKYTDLGFEEATASTIEALNTPTHPYTLHLQKTFTNGATVDREVWECGAFTAAGVCVCRHVFLPYELHNDNIIPPGQSITIDLYIRITPDIITYVKSPETGETVLKYSFTSNFIISASVGKDAIDPSSYPCEKEKICYNGIVLPNASPPIVTEARGGKTWQISCSTTDPAQVQAIVSKQGLIKTGVSVTGYQYATSLQRYGVLKIWDKTTRTHETYDNCLISGPVTVELFGETYMFDLTIVQSYYGDV